VKTEHDVPLRPDDPRKVGGYALIGRLGEGGQGVVYLGKDGDGGLVTVKLLRGGSAASPRARNRFIKEAAAARRVVAPHTARILDAEVTGDRPYIVSEFVEGPTLQSIVAEKGPLAGPELRRIALRTAGALTAIHKAGIVHRDFKPGNVVIGSQGAKVIDFGVARALDSETPQTSHPVGTPAYMAPEQIEDHPIGPPADVFAWGASLVYAATGRPPFGDGPSSAAVMRRIVDREPDLGLLKGSLRGLVARCLDKEPAARPTAAEIVRFLRSEAKPKPKPTKVPAYRSRMIYALALVVLLGFTLGLVLSG
jgi:serine/threonine protein kinase